MRCAVARQSEFRMCIESKILLYRAAMGVLLQNLIPIYISTVLLYNIIILFSRFAVEQNLKPSYISRYRYEMFNSCVGLYSIILYNMLYDIV